MSFQTRPSEKEEKIKNKTAKIDDYKMLLILYSPVKNPDNSNFKRISQKLIENFPDYPEGYLIMTDFIYHNYPDKYSEILNYEQKGIEAYKNVNTKKYSEFFYESSRNHPMNELFAITIDVYLKKGEKEKALDVFNKNKKIIFAFLILGSVYSFAAQKTLRTVEKCRVTSRGMTKDGKKFANCISLQSGKTFNFTGLVDQTYHKFSKGTVFKVYFYGNGNRNLTLETFDYIQ